MRRRATSAMFLTPVTVASVLVVLAVVMQASGAVPATPAASLKGLVAYAKKTGKLQLNLSGNDLGSYTKSQVTLKLAGTSFNPDTDPDTRAGGRVLHIEATLPTLLDKPAQGTRPVIDPENLTVSVTGVTSGSGIDVPIVTE